MVNMGFGTDDFSRIDTGFTIFMILFALMFVAIIGVFIVVAVKGIGTWNKNNKSPRLTVHATVISKRTMAHHRDSGVHGTGMHGGYSTRYFVAFQVDSGDRMELQVEGSEFGILVEGDNGYLTFQGTRYLGFQRRLQSGASSS